MKKPLHIFLISVLSLFALSSYGQEWEWVKLGRAYTNGSNSYRQTVTGITVDFWGNTVVAGNFESQYISFDAISLRNTFFDNSFIAKYNKAGKVVWVDAISSDPKVGGRPEITALAQDSNENIYVVGHYNGSIIFSSSVSLPAASLNGPIKSFLAKYDKNGNVLWAKAIGTGEISPLALTCFNSDVIVTGKFYNTAGFGAQTFSALGFSDIFLTKFDEHGNLKWGKAFAGNGSDIGEDIKTDNKGNIFLAGVFDFGIEMEGSSLHSDKRVTHFLARFSVNGELQWAKPLNSSNNENSISVDKTGSVYLTGSCSKAFTIDEFEVVNTGQDYSTSDIFVSKIGPEGKAEWIKSYGSTSNEIGVAIATDTHGDSFVTGFFNKEFAIEGSVLKNDPLTQNDYKFDLFLFKIDRNGAVKWVNSAKINLYQASFDYVRGLGIATDKVGNISVCGAYAGIGLFNTTQLPTAHGNIFTAKLTDTGFVPPASSFIRGNVFEDINGNKTKDAAEPGIADIILKAEPGPYYAVADLHGNFFMDIEPGSYTVSQLLPASKTNIIKQVYPENNNSLTVDLPESSTSASLNFANQITKCTQLTVDIAADRRRRCFRSQTTVTYANEGSVDASNVKIKVIYPRYVVPISSQLPWSARLDSALVFDVGTLKAGERKSFVITDSTVCGNEGIRGLSQCMQAFITPRSSCTTASPEWEKASVAVASSFTDQDKMATFTIANQGAGDMSDSASYRLYANTALIKRGKVRLVQGAVKTLAVPAQAVTFRLEADQVPGHPGNSRPTVSLQPPMVPLKAPAAALPTPIEAFYQDDADAEVAISCLPIVDSYDPNDKLVSPQGVTSKRYVKAEDELKYMIRFQNTGTDEAYNVVVEDTISEYLDISTLRVGSASHPFTYSVSGKGKPLLRFSFTGIHLPDSKTDEPGSHGYVTFTIAQHAGNPKGTVIRNTAYNYFDYNSPVSTNEVINVIGDTVLAPAAPFVVYDCGEDAPTVALSAAIVNLCDASTTVLQANEPEKGIGRWRLISGQATILDPNKPTSGVQNIGFGETVVEWTITLCSQVSRARVHLHRSPLPPQPQLASAPLQCKGMAPAALTAIGSNITWYQDAARQQKLFSGNSYTPATTTADTLYATQTIDGCESSAAPVVVRPYPEVKITARADTLVAPQADSYQWFFNNQPVAGGTGQTLLARNTGQYRVQTVTGGCESSSKDIVHTVYLPKPVLTVAPNPVQKELLVVLASNATGQVNIVVRDQLGKPVLRQSGQKEDTVWELTLPMEGLAPGMYFLDVQLREEVHKAKIVKL